MKKYLVVLAAMAMVIAMVSGAYAGSVNNTNTAVTASVSAVCTAPTAGSITFAAIDPSSTSTATATPSPDAKVNCTNGSGYTVTALSQNAGGSTASCAGTSNTGGITGTLKGTGTGTDTDAITYSFTCGTASGTGAGFGSGTAQNINVAAYIISSAFQNAVADTYSDKVTVTISY
jgi:spore coat protein U-like protein